MVEVETVPPITLSGGVIPEHGERLCCISTLALVEGVHGNVEFTTDPHEGVGSGSVFVLQKEMVSYMIERLLKNAHWSTVTVVEFLNEARAIHMEETSLVVCVSNIQQGNEMLLLQKTERTVLVGIAEAVVVAGRGNQARPHLSRSSRAKVPVVRSLSPCTVILDSWIGRAKW